MSVGRDLRAAIFRCVSGFSTHQMSKFGPATLITRGTNDVQQLQMVMLMAMSMLVLAPIMAVGGVAMALREDAGLSWLVWVAVPIIVAIMVFAGLKMVPLFRQMQEAIDDVNHILREQITGMRVVRAFVREDYEAQRFTKANQHLTGLAIGSGRFSWCYSPSSRWCCTVPPPLSMVRRAARGRWISRGRLADGFMQYLLQI